MDITNGTTKRIDCPNCGGYRTFTVTNNMGSLVWNCYKASCNIKGGTRVHLSMDDIRAGFGGAEQFATQTFELPSYIIPHRDKRTVLNFCFQYNPYRDPRGEKRCGAQHHLHPGRDRLVLRRHHARRGHRSRHLEVPVQTCRRSWRHPTLQ